MSTDEKVKKLKIGDLMGIRSGGGRRSRVYKIAPVERMTMQRIIVDGRFFYKDGLREVGGLASVEFMTAQEIAAWREEETKRETEREERRRNYNPKDHYDVPEAALSSLRDKARTLCEKLQFECELRASAGKERPDWFPQFMMLVQEIDDSEKALKSIGLSTTLKSFAEVSSIFG